MLQHDAKCIVDVSRVLAYLDLRQMTSCLFSSFHLFSLPHSSRHLCSSNVHYVQRLLVLVASCPAGRVRPPPWLAQVRCKTWVIIQFVNSQTRKCSVPSVSFGAKFMNPLCHSIVRVPEQQPFASADPSQATAQTQIRKWFRRLPEWPADDPPKADSLGISKQDCNYFWSTSTS